MQIYCEPYFAAMSRWITDEKKGEELLKSRLQTIETAEKIFQEYSQLPDNYEFTFDYENCDEESIQLLPEYLPTPG
jgi:hypothetical protein